MEATEKQKLSTEEVCSILDKCKSTGVAELKFSGLHVRFSTTAEQLASIGLTDYPMVQRTPQNAGVADLTPEQHEAQTKEAIELDELRLREEQLARALVEDPEEYERLLRDGELSDDVDSADDDSE